MEDEKIFVEKNKLQTASIMQKWQGRVCPSTSRQLLPYFKFMNEKFREKNFSGINTKAGKTEMVAYMEQRMELFAGEI
jgi:hypothetical protein